MNIPVSVFIIACNEAARIGATLKALAGLSDDIVVVDSGSTDGTQEIAAAFGARVVFNEWPGYGKQKQFGESECKHEWILNVDADEVITDALKEEIIEIFSAGNPDIGAYSTRIVEVIPGDTSPRLFANCHNYVRLYHRAAGRYSSSIVHDAVCLNPGISPKQMNGTINHFSFVNISTQIGKFNRYSDDLVRDLETRGRSIPLWRVFVEFPMAFFKAFIIRRHFVRGVYGYITAMNYAIFRYLRVSKYYEIRGFGRHRR